MKKIHLIIFLFLTPCFMGIHACSHSDSTETPLVAKVETAKQLEELAVLTIEDKQLTRADFNHYLSMRYSDLDIKNAKPTLLSRLFDNFVEDQILSAMADKSGMTITAEELPELSERLNLPADSLPRPILMETARVQKFLFLEYYRKLEISEKEIRAYYQSNRRKFQKQAEVHLYQILVATREKAIQLRGILLNSPDRFEELARTESISPEAANSGYMGTFEKGTLPEEMENVVFSLPVQQISPLVESKYGHHIFKVTSHTYRRLLPLQRVRDQIRSQLMTEKMRDAYDRMMVQARESLILEAHTENLDFSYTFQTGDNDET